MNEVSEYELFQNGFWVLRELYGIVHLWQAELLAKPYVKGVLLIIWHENICWKKGLCKSCKYENQKQIEINDRTLRCELKKERDRLQFLHLILSEFRRIN